MTHSHTLLIQIHFLGRDDEATSSSTGSRGPRGRNAQYYRDYRARKRAEQEKWSLNRISDPSTTADSSTVTSKTRKSAAEYQREYRARIKAKLRYGVSQRGNPILMVGGNRFKKTSGYGKKSWWHCIKRSSTSCPANLMRAILRARFCRDSTNIFIGGQKFFRHSRSLMGNRIRWTCAKKHKLKCKASAVTIDGVVVSTTGLHSHN
ncbi:unnamed protein product [Pieris macdunnoughi]|uniref:FLYWCH-type domain-containing protein n=1 Tax=Pieris macdunnoughi TaxID=345717 RepID=A0A821Q522_9NEOP|nr:unnamed protein product [Pieris macdunnoughi]